MINALNFEINHVPNNKNSNLFYPHVIEIQKAFDSTGKSMSEVASKGGMNPKTFKKCFDKDNKITLAKANGVVNGLNKSGANPPVTREVLFSQEHL